jgi:hypothetical protein
VKYNVLEDHDEIFVIPEMLTSDRPLFVGITSLGFYGEGHDRRVQWAYTFAYGPYDADIQLQGDDLGSPYDDSEKAVTALLGFYGAYADGTLIRDRETDTLTSGGDVVATGETARFIVANGERFSIVESELENGYAVWNDPIEMTVYHHILPGVEVRSIEYTGKEDE